MIIYRDNKKNIFEAIKKTLLWFVGMFAMGALYYAAINEEDGWAQQAVAIFFAGVMMFYGIRGLYRMRSSSPYNKKILVKNGVKTEGKILTPTYIQMTEVGFKYEYCDKKGVKRISNAGKRLKSLDLEVGSNLKVIYNKNNPKINVILID